MKLSSRLLRMACAAALLALSIGAHAATTTARPNILVIWGDDVGIWNISAYHRGMMGGATPNIDRIGQAKA